MHLESKTSDCRTCLTRKRERKPSMRFLKLLMPGTSPSSIPKLRRMLAAKG